MVLENIHRYIDEGYPADEDAELGRNEIGMAAIAMTLCDIVVFLPIAFMESSTGQFFKQFDIYLNSAFISSRHIFRTNYSHRDKQNSNNKKYPYCYQNFFRMQQTLLQYFCNADVFNCIFYSNADDGF